MLRPLATLLLSCLVACSGSTESVVAPASSAPSPDGGVSDPATPSAPDATAATDGGQDAPTLATDYFPPPGDNWETTTPTAAGFDAAKLDEVSAYVGGSNATTFMIVFDGRILVEKYWGATPTTLRDIASAQKSVSSLLAGAAIMQGLFGLNDTVTSLIGAGWSNASTSEEAPITVRHILTMTSGLNANLEYAAPAGTAWLYNTDGYHRMDLILAAKSGKTLQEYTRAALFDRIGVGNSAWGKRQFQKDAKGEPMNALEMNARDMARVGLLVMREGKWLDQTVVPKSYLDEALAPSQPLNQSYGFLFWLNGQPSVLMPPSNARPGPMFPSAPSDVVSALGANDQKIHVSRGQKLVVVRQGASAGEPGAAATAFDDELWKKIMAAKLP